MKAALTPQEGKHGASQKKKNELKKTSQGNWVGEVVEGGSSLERFCWPTVFTFFYEKDLKLYYDKR